jgi:hypothetical protein
VTCRTCKFLNVAPDSRGRIIPRANIGYRCLYEVSIEHGLPASVTGAYNFRWPPSKKSMVPNDGEGCPQHVQRGKAP